MEPRVWFAHFWGVTKFLVICAFYAHVVNGDHSPFTRYYKPGDFILGGLFSFYREVNGTCSALNTLRHTFGRIEAMIYAIEKINNDSNILQNVTLGYSIYDDCGQESFGLASSLHMLGLHDTCDARTNEPPIVGIIGPEYTKVTIAANHLFSFYEVPHISASASSDELSDRTRFPYFSRLVPSDNFQIGAIIDIIEHFKWKYVSAVYSNEDYGEHGIGELIDRSLKNDKFCLGATVAISESATRSEVDRAIRQISRRADVEVIVLFSLPGIAQKFLDGMARADLIGKYTMICSDAIIALRSNQVYFNQLKGSILINPYSSQRLPYFDKHINEVGKAAMDDINSTNNTFIRALVNGCNGQNKNRNESEKMCAELNQTQLTDYSLRTWAAIVIDAVNVIAHALNSTRSEKTDGVNLYNQILNTSFYGERGLIKFMENGDFPGSYIIENIVQDGDKCTSRVVGRWDTQNETRLSFTGDVQWPFDHDPIAICSQPCPAGMVMKEHGDNPLCCWECFECLDYQITSDNGTMCLECPDFYWPDTARTKCELVDPKFMRIGDPAAVFFILLSTLGLIISVLTSVVYIYHRNHTLIKASGREVMCIIMIGVVLSYIMVFFFVSEPKNGVCGVARVGLIMSFTWTYAPLLVKVFRINRIFHSAQKSPQKPKYIETSYQILFSIFLISFQLVISIMWITIKEPAAVKENPVLYQREVTLRCNFQQVEIITSSIYNIILIGLCCYYAIRTRKLPDNFKETKFIGVSVYITLSIFVVFIPSYFVVTEPVTRSAILCGAVVGNASTTLVCLFLSKLYAVYFIVDRNLPSKRTSSIPIAHSSNTPVTTVENSSNREQMFADVSTDNVSVM
ncbi:metabotropic glutamate receptor-like isoform X2 [Antedon mediterranea]|uniref:metabotropic glutamate receptor-like isoform X2 n=1 Tax=Antedon mediterranea TaxID=105859 RepID=UPI003AF41D1A